MAEYYVSKRKLCASFEKNAAQFDSIADAEYAAWLLGICPCEDVAEVKHGRWFETSQPIGWAGSFRCAECSACGEDFVLDEYGIDEIREYFKYCPNCGAKMDGKGGGND